MGAQGLVGLMLCLDIPHSGMPNGVPRSLSIHLRGTDFSTIFLGQPYQALGIDQHERNGFATNFLGIQVGVWADVAFPQLKKAWVPKQEIGGPHMFGSLQIALNTSKTQ